MHPQHFLERYIVPREYAYLVFSELPDRPVLDFSQGFLRIDDVPAFGRDVMCRGLFPVLMIQFDYAFGRSVSAEELEDFLLDDLKEDDRFRFSTAFVSEEMHEELLERVRLHVIRGQVLMKPGEESTQWFCDCPPDEHLVYVWIGLEPVPGVRASA